MPDTQTMLQSDVSGIGQQLQYSGQSELLDAINELTRRGIGGRASLPQLIVCGDQSSGKSSVLEAISHIRFPAKDNLCTTFATELIVRRELSNRKPVCIIPGPSSFGDNHARSVLEKFPGSQSYDRPEDVPSLIESARQAMQEASETSANSIFDDKLRVRLCQPEWPPITIVDLPGIIHEVNVDPAQNDVTIVRDMVKQYMNDPRSIILAIVSAQSAPALQLVLSLAKAADPDRKRTMGIITKPDTLVDQDRKSIGIIRKLTLNESESNQSKLRWHVLKNRDPKNVDQTAAERDASETTFFKQAPWEDFQDQNCLGIDSLRLRLSKIIHENIASSLPDIIGDTYQEITKSETELAKLGKERSSRQAKEVHLIGIAQQFQTLAQSAVDGVRGDQFDTFLENTYTNEGYDKRLRAVVQNLNDQFSVLMSSKGHRWVIEGDEAEEGELNAASAQSKRLDTKMNDNYPGADQFTAAVSIDREVFIRKIEMLSRATRGRELSGVFNHHIVGELFREQSAKWTTLAEHHVQTVWRAVKLFLEDAFSSLADTKTSNAILLDVVDPLMETKNTEAKIKLHEILVPHTRFHPISYNNKLAKSMNEAKYKRELTRVREEAVSILKVRSTDVKDLSNEYLEMLSIQTTVVRKPGENFGFSEIIDYMNAYYDISMNIFVDNVATLVVESCLIADLARIFPADKIPQMDDYTLDRLASESEEAQSKRKKLESNLTCLRDSLKICQKHLIHVPRELHHKSSTRVSATIIQENRSNSGEMPLPSQRTTSKSTTMISSRSFTWKPEVRLPPSTIVSSASDIRQAETLVPERKNDGDHPLSFEDSGSMPTVSKEAPEKDLEDSYSSEDRDEKPNSPYIFKLQGNPATTFIKLSTPDTTGGGTFDAETTAKAPESPSLPSNTNTPDTTTRFGSEGFKFGSISPGDTSTLKSTGGSLFRGLSSNTPTGENSTSKSTSGGLFGALSSNTTPAGENSTSKSTGGGLFGGLPSKATPFSENSTSKSTKSGLLGGLPSKTTPAGENSTSKSTGGGLFGALSSNTTPAGENSTSKSTGGGLFGGFPSKATPAGENSTSKSTSSGLFREFPSKPTPFGENSTSKSTSGGLLGGLPSKTTPFGEKSTFGSTGGNLLGGLPSKATPFGENSTSKSTSSGLSGGLPSKTTPFGEKSTFGSTGGNLLGGLPSKATPFGENSTSKSTSSGLSGGLPSKTTPFGEKSTFGSTGGNLLGGLPSKATPFGENSTSKSTSGGLFGGLPSKATSFGENSTSKNTGSGLFGTKAASGEPGKPASPASDASIPPIGKNPFTSSGQPVTSSNPILTGFGAPNSIGNTFGGSATTTSSFGSN